MSVILTFIVVCSLVFLMALSSPDYNNRRRELLSEYERADEFVVKKET